MISFVNHDWSRLIVPISTAYSDFFYYSIPGARFILLMYQVKFIKNLRFDWSLSFGIVTKPNVENLVLLLKFNVFRVELVKIGSTKDLHQNSTNNLLNHKSSISRGMNYLFSPWICSFSLNFFLSSPRFSTLSPPVLVSLGKGIGGLFPLSISYGWLTTTIKYKYFLYGSFKLIRQRLRGSR